jgi:hypothetical protein
MAEEGEQGDGIKRGTVKWFDTIKVCDFPFSTQGTKVYIMCRVAGREKTIWTHGP